MRISNLDPDTLDTIRRLVDAKVSWLGRKYSLQYADQEDIRQEGMLTALESLRDYKARKSTLATFLTPRITFAMLDRMFDTMGHGLTGGHEGVDIIDITEILGEDDDGADGLRDSPEADALTVAEEADNTLDIAAALAQLPLRERNLMELYFGIGLNGKPMTLSALARRNRCSLASVFRRVSENLKSLKILMDQEDQDCTSVQP